MKPRPRVQSRAPEEPPGELVCACANVRRASRVITQFYESEFKSSPFTIAQFGLLGSLATYGMATQARLGELLSIDSTTLSRTLRPLIRKKWIERIQGTDRREQYLQLTSLGRRQLKLARPYWLRAQQRLRRSFGDEDWKRLQSLLTRAVQAAQKA